MNYYNKISKLGNGTFSNVYKCINLKGETVAVKKIKKDYRDEQSSEVNILKTLNQYDNKHIIKLLQTSNDFTIMEFEYIEYNLLEYQELFRISPNQIMAFCRQLLSGLEFIHNLGIIHCDIKPENLLITGFRLKIADFGISCFVDNINEPDYTCTPSYRAPELLFGREEFGTEIDIWSAGCVILELHLQKMPVFFGDNNGKVLTNIFKILGTPTEQDIPEIAEYDNIPKHKQKNIKLPEVVWLMLSYNNRLSASELLEYFK